jgi:hypothetical protein
MKKFLYTNGTSITAGGGFEEYQYRKDVRNSYKLKNIELPNSQIECSYPYFISKNLGLTLINDAKSGSGAGRTLRTTYEWINKNQHLLDKTIFLIEFQSGIRIDFYIEEYKKYFILNAHLKEGGKIDWTVVTDWYIQSEDSMVKLNDKYRDRIENYLYNFWNVDMYMETDIMYAKLLLSYMNKLNLTYFFSDGLCLGSEFSKNKINDIFDGNDIWQYARTNKLLIMDEVDNDDNHLGYSGNQIIAEHISNYINNVNI